MNLYKIEQGENNGYDTYDSAVVVAKDEDDAREIHPSEFKDFDDWKTDEINWDWVTYKERHKISVTYLGPAYWELQRGVVVASFNAG